MDPNAKEQLLLEIYSHLYMKPVLVDHFLTQYAPQAFKERLNETKEHNTLQTMLQPYIFQKCIFDKHPETRSDDVVLSDL